MTVFTGKPVGISLSINAAVVNVAVAAVVLTDEEAVVLVLCAGSLGILANVRTEGTGTVADRGFTVVTAGLGVDFNTVVLVLLAVVGLFVVAVTIVVMPLLFSTDGFVTVPMSAEVSLTFRRRIEFSAFMKKRTPPEASLNRSLTWSFGLPIVKKNSGLEVTGLFGFRVTANGTEVTERFFTGSISFPRS